MSDLDKTMRCYGTVHLMDWISSPRGQVKSVTGEIEVVSDEDTVGFRARGANSANWLARISDGEEIWHLFGCQIRGIVEHKPDCFPLVDTWVVGQ